MPTVIPAKQLQVIEDNQSGLADSLLEGETGWSSEDSTLFIKEPGGGLKPVVPAATEEYVDTAVAMEREERLAGDSSLQASIDAHTSRTDNPHNVTAGQVGAYTKQETEDRISDADAEIITSLEDETTARRVNDELLQQQIEEVAVQTDWEQDDAMALDYLKNKPTTITDAEIEALFI